MTAAELTFLTEAYSSALSSGHIFPGAAAAEAALESAWGTSALAVRANNLFGLKKAQSWTGQVIILTTREFLHRAWTTISAEWPVFASWSDCMRERMSTLHRLPCYRDALQASTPEEFVTRVSVHWSTGPDRAREVLSIYHSHLDILAQSQEAA